MYQPVDGGFPLALRMLHNANVNTLLSNQNKDVILNNFINELSKKYGKDSIAYLEMIPYRTLPIINRIDIFTIIRDKELKKYVHTFIDKNGILYSTSVIVSLRSVFVLQAGTYLQFMNLS